MIAFLLTGEWVHGQDHQDKIYATLSAEDFYLSLHSSENHVVLDVRTFKEFRKERIPEAVHAETLGQLLQMADNLDIDQPVFIYCSDNYRSPVACQLLAEKGFSRVYNLDAGLSEWKTAGYAIDKKRICFKRSITD